MKKRTNIWDGFLVVAFCLFLCGMLLLFFLLPKVHFSENEKRYLVGPPILSWEQLTSGRFSQEAETYIADHLPFRNAFVAINAYWDLYSGRQSTKDIYVAEGARLVERPIYDTGNLEKNVAFINRFQESIGRPMDVMLVPNAGYLLEEGILGRHDPYMDETYLAEIADGWNDGVVFYDLQRVLFQDPGAYFYRTDHHWTSAGAYAAYAHYMQMKEKEVVYERAFDVRRTEGFHGSTYSRSALWLIPPEDLEIWDAAARMEVYISDDDSTHDSMFFPDRLLEADKYTVFLDGNHSLVRIHNRDGAGKGKLLLIRDSFGNSLAPFLALGYEEVVLVDLRYYKSGILPLMALEEFDDILLLYGLNNFLKDTNFAWLK